MARRYQFHFCVDRCRQTIMDMDSTQLPWDSALALLPLPRGLRENPSFRPLEQVGLSCCWVSAGDACKDGNQSCSQEVLLHVLHTCATCVKLLIVV